MEVLQDSGWKIGERGLKLDHSHYSLFAAVGKTVAALEGFVSGIGFGTAPGIGTADRGIVVGCIEADTLQWGNSPPAGWHSCSVSGHHHIRCWPEWVGRPTEGRLRGSWGKHAHLWVCSCAHCCNWLLPYRQNSDVAFYLDPYSSPESYDMMGEGVFQVS